MRAAIDPGVSTGVAVRLPDNSILTATMDRKMLLSFFKDSGAKITDLALEKFARSNRIDTNMIHTMENVGIVIGVCHVLGIKRHDHVPQERYSFMDEAEAILDAKGAQYTQHEHDALAHLLLLEQDLAGVRR